jgi:4-amino-4-deoxy-L-arabinose transferase-like glycosyltransferase
VDTLGTGSRSAAEHTQLRVHRIPIVLISAALLVRLGALLLQGANAPDWDSVNFFRTAESLLSGNGYVGIRGTLNLVHSPLYPLLVAGGVFITRHAAVGVGLAISIVAGALFPLCIYGVASRIFDRFTGIVAGGIAVVHPVLVALSLDMIADQLALTLEFGGLYLFLRWLDDRRSVQLAGCGAIWGLAYLARAEALIYVAVAAVAVAVFLFRRPGRLGSAAFALLGPFIVLVAPYVVFLTLATGNVRLEAKSPVNYAIGVRIERGMNYAEAANGLGPALSEDGAELGGGFFVSHARPYGPTLNERIAFAVRELPHALREVGRRLLSLHYGTPLFAVLALAGVVRAFRSRRSAERAVIVLACFAGQLAALTSVAHFWDRYAAPFAPYSTIFGAAGIALVFNMIPSAALRRGAVVAAATLALAVFAYTVRDLRANVLDPRPLQATGYWISLHEPRDIMIQSVTPLVPYYAGARWNALPYADSATAAAYVRRKHPDLVVLEPRDVDRPYLADWRAHGIPNDTARLVYRSPGAPEDAVLVYEESGQAVYARNAGYGRGKATEDPVHRVAHLKE